MDEMITPIRILSKKEIEENYRKIEALGEDGLIQHLIDKGWSNESAQILAKAMLKRG